MLRLQVGGCWSSSLGLENIPSLGVDFEAVAIGSSFHVVDSYPSSKSKGETSPCTRDAVAIPSLGYDLIMKILQMSAGQCLDGERLNSQKLTWFSAALSAKAIFFWAMNLDLAKYRVDVETGVE